MYLANRENKYLERKARRVLVKILCTSLLMGAGAAVQQVKLLLVILASHRRVQVCIPAAQVLIQLSANALKKAVYGKSK